VQVPTPARPLPNTELGVAGKLLLLRSKWADGMICSRVLFYGATLSPALNRHSLVSASLPWRHLTGREHSIVSTKVLEEHGHLIDGDFLRERVDVVAPIAIVGEPQ
jgi:hypothetical protein